MFSTLPEETEAAVTEPELKPQPFAAFGSFRFSQPYPSIQYENYRCMNERNLKQHAENNENWLLEIDQLAYVARILTFLYLSAKDKYTLNEADPKVKKIKNNFPSLFKLETKTAELMSKENQDMDEVIKALIEIFVSLGNCDATLANIILVINKLYLEIIEYCKEQIETKGFVPQFTNMLNILASETLFQKGITEKQINKLRGMLL